MPANWTTKQLGGVAVKVNQFVGDNKMVDESIRQSMLSPTSWHMLVSYNANDVQTCFSSQHALAVFDRFEVQAQRETGQRPTWPLPNLILATRADTQAELDANWECFVDIPAVCCALVSEPKEQLRMPGDWICATWVDILRQGFIHWLLLTYNGQNESHIADLIDQAKAAGVPVWVRGHNIPASIRRSDLPGVLKGEAKCG